MSFFKMQEKIKMNQNKEKQINIIINDFIYYDNGTYKRYINVGNLSLLIEGIKNCNETTKYIKIIPFYRNPKHSLQIKYERYMFYIECIPKASKLQQRIFYKTAAVHENDNVLTNDEMKILTVLCDSKDVKKFQKSILKYKEYLYSKLPELLNEIITQYNLDIDDLSYGYFCFDITSE